MKIVFILFVVVELVYARKPEKLFVNYGDELEYPDYYRDVNDGADPTSTQLPIGNGGHHQGGRFRSGINCGHFDSKDTTHLVADPNHTGSFYFCVNGVKKKSVAAHRL
ncbi:Hypothetical predicted protein [Octopus vulgaris]|uniref:Uncharacterized protein n=1 Tax=Octopus vulgaris TaxID=6645 RepID=A0AA36FFA5_OCTVU|nr:Hypothetical predicted protein [Octopus vulgaris]